MKYKQYKILPDYLIYNLNITELRLINNEIELIESKAFKNSLNQSQLIYLNLNRNKIKMIQKGTLDDLYLLNTLILSINLINDLPNRIFSSLKNLIQLDLGDNQI
jgi:Leucine-rich repeat (LRR) protein